MVSARLLDHQLGEPVEFEGDQQVTLLHRFVQPLNPGGAEQVALALTAHCSTGVPPMKRVDKVLCRIGKKTQSRAYCCKSALML